MDCFYVMDNVLNVDNDYYFVSLYNNWIYRIDGNTFQIEKYVQIPFERLQGYMEYSKMYYYDEKFFILPWFSSKIAVFDINNNVFRYIQMDKEIIGLRYFMAVPRGELLYLIPCESKDILVINMCTEKVEESIPIAISKENVDKVVSWCNIIYEKDGIIIPQVYDNRLIKLNFLNNTIEFRKSPFEGNTGLCGICDTNDGRWYIPRSADRLIFENLEGMHIYSDFPDGYIAGNISFYKIIPDNHRVFLLPRDANMFIVVTEEGQFYNLMKIRPDKTNSMERYMYFSNVWTINNKYFCVESRSGTVYEITIDYTLIPFSFKNGDTNKTLSLFDDTMVCENPYHEKTLSGFISYIIDNRGE